ncbi:MAG: 3-phosphoglycerate dehydrogenase [Clostridia bacterium]|nr:3-phosphoglycerate dehydrogenase [Clostridia bacterium]
MAKILKLNKISKVANSEFPASYTLTDECEQPDGIILRSFKMHDYPLADSLLCVARAGAGVNNIPLDKCADKGVVVFNTPGANSNAVKELALCMLFMCGRRIAPALTWSQGLKGTAEIGKQVEDGKKAFVGGEIFGKTLGIAGLGAIGSKLAKAAFALGMNVIGYDPHITKERIDAINPDMRIVSLEELYKECDYISLHVPFNDNTKHMINAETIAMMKDGVNIINCARGELVDNAAIVEAVKSGKVNRYVTDFPNEEVLGIDGIVATPHLGASTPEAEDNCAYMAAKQMVDFIENGNIVNSVNYPKLQKERTKSRRLCVCTKDVEDIKALLAKHCVCVDDMAEAHRGVYGYAVVDVDCDCTADKLSGVEGILKARFIG